MPDLDLDNEMLRRELEKVAKFWLDEGADGFRLDAAKEYFSGSTDKNIEVLAWFTDYCKSVKPDCYLVAEVWDSFSAYTKYYQSGIDSVFDFTLAQADGKIAKTLNADGSQYSAASFAQAVVTIQDTLKKNGISPIDAPFIANHDLARNAGVYGYDEDKIKLAAGLLLSMPGSPFVYYGEETGMTGAGTDPDKRAPMNWVADTSAAGMTDGPPEMDTQENQFPALDEQLNDADSIANYYKRALRIRNENPQIARGTVTAIALSNTETAALTYDYNGQTLMAVYNLTGKAAEITDEVLELSDKQIADYLTLSTAEEVVLQGGKLTMPAGSIVYLSGN